MLWGAPPGGTGCPARPQCVRALNQCAASPASVCGRVCARVYVCVCVHACGSAHQTHEAVIVKVRFSHGHRKVKKILFLLWLLTHKHKLTHLNNSCGWDSNPRHLSSWDSCTTTAPRNFSGTSPKDTSSTQAADKATGNNLLYLCRKKENILIWSVVVPFAVFTHRMATLSAEDLQGLIHQFNTASHPQAATTILEAIVEKGNIKDVNIFLESVNPNLEMCCGDKISFVQPASSLLLVMSAKLGFIDLVKVLVETKGADVNSHLNVGELYQMESFPVEAATSKGHAECLEYLLEKGAGVNPQGGDGPIPLWWGVQHGQFECVRILVKYGADVNCTVTPSFHKDDLAEILLIVAAKRGDTRSLRLLVESGADVNQADNKGQTPLLVSAKTNDAACMQLLVEAGADVNHADFMSHTALGVAAEYMSPLCVKLLLESGANVNHIDSDGYTALYKSCMNTTGVLLSKYETVVRLLFAGGAKVNLAWKYTPAIHVLCREQVLLLMFAAGQMNVMFCEYRRKPGVADVRTVTQHYFFPEDWGNLGLKNQCRKVIRKHLLTLDPHTNLFIRVPQLQQTEDREGLPKTLTSYMLYNQSLQVHRDQLDPDNKFCPQWQQVRLVQTKQLSQNSQTIGEQKPWGLILWIHQRRKHLVHECTLHALSTASVRRHCPPLSRLLEGQHPGCFSINAKRLASVAQALICCLVQKLAWTNQVRQCISPRFCLLATLESWLFWISKQLDHDGVLKEVRLRTLAMFCKFTLAAGCPDVGDRQTKVIDFDWHADWTRLSHKDDLPLCTWCTRKEYKSVKNKEKVFKVLEVRMSVNLSYVSRLWTLQSLTQQFVACTHTQIMYSK